jgi:hypothetical protein
MSLIEVLVATLIIMVAMSGFFMSIDLSILQRAQLTRYTMATNMAYDVADKLSKITVTPRSNATAFVEPIATKEKYVGYTADTVAQLKECSGGTPQLALNPEIFASPRGAGGQLYMYDNNTGVFSASTSINTAANPNIHHPNSTDSVVDMNSVINPIRRDQSGVTYYAIWSVAYVPCGGSDQVKLFVTVYWIEPEPSDTTMAAVLTKLANGTAVVKQVTVVTDKAYKAQL